MVDNHESMDNPAKLTGSFITAIILTIFLAGTLDICAAFLNSFIRSGTKPIIVLQYIASGVLGQNSFSMGWVSGAAGLLFHFIFVTVWTLLFFLVYPRLGILYQNKVVIGIVYGLFIWLVMNLVVVPLSHTPEIPFQISHVILGIIYVILCVGLPISIMYWNYMKEQVGAEKRTMETGNERAGDFK